MPSPSAIRHSARLAGFVVVMAALAACTSGTAGASGTPAGASPAALASPSPVATSTAEVSPMPSPSAEAPSPTPSGGGRYGGGYGGGGTPRPAPTPAPAGKAVTVKAASTGVGKVLVGPNGLTLYVLMTDHVNSSTCLGACIGDWPPLTVKSGTKVVGGTGVMGAFATFTRSDGTHQASYRGRPLYYFAGDHSAGDTNGEGIGGVWFVAKP